MKKIFATICAALLCIAATAQTTDYAKLVNPLIGTDGKGNVYPGAQAPFGMVQLSPTHFVACHLYNDKEEDAKIKEAIRPYMQWFDCIAENLRYIVKLDGEKDRWWKKHELEEIIRYNH